MAIKVATVPALHHLNPRQTSGRDNWTRLEVTRPLCHIYIHSYIYIYTYVCGCVGNLPSIVKTHTNVSIPFGAARRQYVLVGGQPLSPVTVSSPTMAYNSSPTPSPIQPQSAPSRSVAYDHNQRRQAHIASEQKRRHAINHGFEGLRRIVPECNNSLDSKAMILNKGTVMLQ